MAVRKLSLAAVVIAVAILAVSASPALAVQSRVFEEGFGPDGTAASVFEQPGPVGVDQSTGATYVADLESKTVQKFNAAHEPEAFAPGAPNVVAGKLTGFNFSGLGELAVDSVSHDFYVVDNATQSLRAYQSNGEPALFTEGPGKGTNEIGGFGELLGVAVDSSGDIYASDFTTGIHVYSPSGEVIQTIPDLGNGYVAVDSTGVLYVNNFGAGVEKLTPSNLPPVTGFTTYTPGGIVDENAATGVAVDPATHHLFVVEHHPFVDEQVRVAEYDEAGTRLGSFASNGPGALRDSEGVAVSTTGQVYVTDRHGKHQVEIFGPEVQVPSEVLTGPADEILPHGARLNGTVNPDGLELSECVFEYGTSETYGQSVPCEESLAEIGKGTEPVQVHATLTGLTPGTGYHYRLRAASEGPGFGEDQTFATPPPPVITAESASNLTKEAADLSVKVNPGGLDTTCTFEYGASTEYANPPLPCTPQPGKGTGDVTITQHIEKLEPDRLHHWRVVATNAAGTTTGVDHTFIYPTAGGGLPDGRAYEMVTPPLKNAALFGAVFSGLQPDIAANGSRFVISTTQCFGDSQSCDAKRDTIGSPYAFSREGGNWVAHALAPPSTQFEASTVMNANADTGAALVSAPTPPRGQDDYYVRQLDGSMTDLGPVTPPELGARGPFGNAHFATADMSHVVVMEQSTGWPFQGADAGVFEYADSGLSAPAPVGVSGGPGSTNLVSFCDTLVGSGNETAASSSALSADGETVFFTARRCQEPEAQGHPEVPADEVYARVGQAETVKLSESECGAGPALNEAACRAAPVADAEFQAASTDGTRALLTSPQQLTDRGSEDSNATDDEEKRQCGEMVASGCNLYEYDFRKPAGQRLVTVSAGDTNGGGPRVQGLVASSNDGSHVYFVARGVLSATANGEGAKAKAGAPNLYLFERDAAHPAGVTTFIATLSDAAEVKLPDFNLWRGSPGWANVSSDGRFLVFYSNAPLTKDDTRPDGGGAQIFRYDAGANALVRVSVGQDSFNDNGNTGAGNATIVHGRKLTAFAGGSGRRDPTMSDNGQRIFFMSPVALTSRAPNDARVGEFNGETEFAQNVYEWEQPGAGSCPAGPSSGCVFLISDGRDVSQVGSDICNQLSAVCLVGTDLTGSNVFFATADQLVPGDTDTQVDFYDARICTSGDPCISGAPAPLPACAGEACHGVPPAPRGALGGGSATFNGTGNLTPPATGGPAKPACASSSGAPAKACTRKQNLRKALAGCRRRFAHARKKRAACERQAHARYGTKTAAHKSTHRTHR